MTIGNSLSWSELGKHYAIKYEQQVQGLLGKADRDDMENAIMVHAAHCANLYLLETGIESNRQRGAWLLSRVYAEVGDGEPALYYASECLRFTQEPQGRLNQVDLVYAEESLARANAVLRHFAEAKEHYQLAVTAAEGVTDRDDRETILVTLIDTAAAVARSQPS